MASRNSLGHNSKITKRIVKHVKADEPEYPRSAYEGWQPPSPPVRETEAIAVLKAAYDNAYSAKDGGPDPENICFRLEGFSIYMPAKSRHGLELTTLDRLQNQGGYSELLFDGTLCFGDQKCFLLGVRFQTLAIEGYNNPCALSMRDRICIQSPLAGMRGVWYQLGRPAREYRRFYDPFTWLAQFTKHFVDFLFETEKVTLALFRRNFHDWMHLRYSNIHDFKAWLEQCDLRDFRTTVCAHVGFLWKECWSVDDRKAGLCKHPIWQEVDPARLGAIPEQKSREEKTIVTKFVYECFKDMYFGSYLEARQVSAGDSLRTIVQRKREMKLTPFGAIPDEDIDMMIRSSPIWRSSEVGSGDVVCVEPDHLSEWKSTSSLWYAYVQHVTPERDRLLLDVIWLYEPQDTTLGTAKYPFKNELFMSDNCSCGSDAVDASFVKGIAHVSWFVHDPNQASGLFVRQKFRTVHNEDTYDFVALREEDFMCCCKTQLSVFEECRQKHQIDDTVLVLHDNPVVKDEMLEPAQIVDFDIEKEQVLLRRLRRKTSFDPQARPNELILTEELYRRAPEGVIRKCNVRFYSAEVIREALPTPYDRGGTGDFFFICSPDGTGSTFDSMSGLDATASERAFSSSNSPLSNPSQAWDTLEPPEFKKLRGLSMFCGGGNFDRGLEDGGALDVRYAVDWAERAIHSYRANVHDPNSVEYFCGSVNDYLARAMEGRDDARIAKPGDVDCIPAGSSCLAFSTLQPDKQSRWSLTNASLVASVVSFVDFYCVEYLILENVVGITYGVGANKDENVFAQILAALVALGYQVQQFHMDAWSYGSSQNRSRVFIVASAPGHEPLPPPQHSHSHPPGRRVTTNCLGVSSNGKPFGIRRDDYTPFQHVSAADATCDLPDIADSQPQICVNFPDHRTPASGTAKSRTRIAMVPTRPYGMGITQAARKGLLNGEPLEYYKSFGPVRRRERSCTYSRVVPTALFPTVVTQLSLACGMSGRKLHWDEHRTVTVMELRRAQGFLDHEVIVGSVAQQVQTIGNSVERNVALVLGLSLRESWTISHRVETRRTPDVWDDDQPVFNIRERGSYKWPSDCGIEERKPNIVEDGDQMTDDEGQEPWRRFDWTPFLSHSPVDLSLAANLTTQETVTEGSHDAAGTTLFSIAFAE